MNRSIPGSLFIVFLLFIGGNFYAFGQDSLAIKEDLNSEIEIRIPDPEVIQGFAEDSDFQYEGLPENPDSLRDRLVALLFRWINFLFGNPVGNFLLRVVLYGFVIALVLAIINQAIGGNLINIFNKKKTGEAFDLNIQEQNINDIDLQGLLNEAIANSNYSIATRYIYLIVLKLLNEKELITWSIEKTNFDYERELSGHRLSSSFNSLTYYYEYVEYGDFNIDKTKFAKVTALYQNLESELSS